MCSRLFNCKSGLLNFWIRVGRACLVSRRCQSEGFRPPTWSKIEVSHLAPVVSGYLPDGFLIGGNVQFGAIALLPRGYFSWKIRRVEDITPGSFSLFFLLQPRLELVVLGTGSRVKRLNPDIAKYLKRKGISLEIQDTPNACASFNYLLDEGRPAGAALMPPEDSPAT